ncbi:MAG: hypothetical protein KTR27_00720 [Leptolyngbyaceae cyanobacterium MAG.088]|nr:hypothetical protein [Leptolyngbyaceae cyanobacterium MAG.088]
MATAPAGADQEADTLVEAYAEDLMDEIFDDVDRILAGEETAIYADPIIQAQEAASGFNAEAVNVPAMIVPFTTQQSAERAIDSDEAAASDDTAASTRTFSKKKRWGNFLLGALCLSALTAAGIWWMRQQPAILQATNTPAIPANAGISDAVVSEEAAFGEYLQRSLRIISGERSAQIETQTPGSIATATAPSANNQASRQQPNVIERVFVPLLQPGSGANQNRPANSSVANNQLPAPNTNTAPETTPADTSASAAPSLSNPNEPVPNIAASSTYELVGVLELGDRSAALFEVNGSSQRVYIGETIGGSGWSIVSINNEEVVVRRNGEVRSIYIGQQF